MVPRTNLLVALFGLLVGVGTILILPSQIAGETFAAIGNAHSPAFFPILIAGLLILCSVALAATALWLRPTAAAEEVEAIEAPIRLFATAALLGTYALLIYWFGMLLASILNIVLLAYTLGFRNHAIIATVAAVVPTTIFLLFEKLLYVLLPEGKLF